ncbi:hypothetical protein Q7P37_002012 [Cladosporium fusiforme]
MFYSHEVLTSRKYGVATVWYASASQRLSIMPPPIDRPPHSLTTHSRLVATLGSKSNLKKVSRKAILDVDVAKTCDTIIDPVAPMALRLSSNLLYGVTRVYAQQCDYVLTDAEAAKVGMRAVFKSLKANELEATGGHKGRSDQLVLQDDPNFLPDLDLLPISLEDAAMVLEVESLRSSSNLTPGSSQHNGGSVHDLRSGLMMPQSASSFEAGGPVGLFGGSLAPSARGGSGGGTRIGSGLFQQDEAHGLLEDDLGMQIDADGNFVLDEDLPAPPVRQPRTRTDRERSELSGGAASARVRVEQGEDQQAAGFFGPVEDDGFVPMQDDEYMFGQGEVFPARTEQHEEVQQDIIASESAEAEQRRHHRGPKTIPIDTSIELHNRDISRWNQQYKQNMDEALRHKRAHRLVTLAKKNAEHWMLGSGVGGLTQSDQGPLNMFSGLKLLETITGLKLTPGGEKRERDEDPKSDDSRRVRARRGPSSDEVGRGFDMQDDGFMPAMDDYTIEQGRDQPTPLDDRYASSVFPWNQSTGSRRPTALFSAGGTSAAGALPLPGLSRRGSRLPTASPLNGRGIAVDNDDYDLRLPGSTADFGATADEEFELFGPAAKVDTQTAAESQWVRAALDGESANFLDFVKTGIEELDQQRRDVPLGDEEDDSLLGTIDFDQLLPTQSNSRVVAAQGLMHVLALVTKNTLAAAQDETFGPIGLRVLEV